MTSMAMRRRAGLLLGAVLVVSLVSPPSATGATEVATLPATVRTLTNLTHLNDLTDRIAVADTPAHSTYRLGTEPTVGVLWVYADDQPDGSFKRTGGGPYDPVLNHYGQGAFDADDIARAAVVYLRQWRATGDTAARDEAYQQLRGLTYLQTLTGSHAGDVVLWMQPTGELNPSPTPVELPNPSDSGASYWLARTLWALGEGYRAFRDTDPQFAAFLQARMDLAVTALRRDVLTRYGTYQTIHGVRVPQWLIVDGADASSEAVLGLSAYVQATGNRPAITALRQLSSGIAAMSAGSVTSWPYRALLPWALSRSDWHAWGANMTAALAAASSTLGDTRLLSTAVSDAAGFTPQLLTSTGPVNGLLPTPGDPSQIAYGADARVQGLLAVGSAANRPGIRQLAGIAAGWFFGQNSAGAAVYDPATGVTRDGISADGQINLNSGAESTIHGLLTMQTLDANPDLAALALSAAGIRQRNGLQVVEAEAGTRTGRARVKTPESAWTGESRWSGGHYVSAAAGSSVTWRLAASSEPRLIQPVVGLLHGSTALSVVTSGKTLLGLVRYGAVGAQGNAVSPIELLPVDLRNTLGPRSTAVTISTVGGTGSIDALLVMPEVATLLTGGQGHVTALLTSKSMTPERRSVALGGSGAAKISSYDRSGRLVDQRTALGGTVSATVAAGGFTVLIR